MDFDGAKPPLPVEWEDWGVEAVVEGGAAME